MPFRDQVTFVRTAPYCIEAIPVGTSKAFWSFQCMQRSWPLIHLRSLLLVIAENDLEMIQFAGHGVAMGNACDALKRCC